MLVLAASACGRFGFEDRRGVPGDAIADGARGSDARDAATDGPAAATTYYEVSTVGTTTMTATVFALDIASGQLSQVGSWNVTSVVAGLAYGGDSNTLYAVETGTIYKLTLSPFAATVIQTGNNAIPDLELDGSELIGVLDGSSTFVRFTPGGAMTSLTVKDGATPITAMGGDLAHARSGTWYWYTNTNNTLYTMDVTTAAVTPVVAVTAPYAAGLIADDAGNLYITSASPPSICEIDPATGACNNAVTLCVSCPTAYTLGPGDSTRTP